jgi:hypothetical protein
MKNNPNTEPYLNLSSRYIINIQSGETLFWGEILYYATGYRRKIVHARSFGTFKQKLDSQVKILHNWKTEKPYLYLMMKVTWPKDKTEVLCSLMATRVWSWKKYKAETVL